MKRFVISIITLLALELVLSGQTRSSKKGIAFGYHLEADMAADSKGLSWWYNWAVAPDYSVKDVFGNYNMDFVPMAWNGGFNETALREFYASHPNSKYLLGFNEPNFTTQANITPREAAALWPRLENIARDYNLELVGPAVNYCDKCISVNGVQITDPVQYLDSFFVACPDCKVDYIAVHNYMCYSTALSSYIDRFKKYGRKIWLTEFACWDQPGITIDMQKSYILGALDYLENDTMIFRYSWFTGDRSNNYPYISLLNPQAGQLSELGNIYINYHPVHDTGNYTDVPSRIEAEAYNAMYGVSIEAVQDVDGIADVGWIDPGDWLEYNINVPETKDYLFLIRTASNAGTSIHVREHDNILGTLPIPYSGGWQNWTTLKMTLALSQGKHKLRITTNTGRFNLNWIEISDNVNSIIRINRDSHGNRSLLYPNPVHNILNIKTEDPISAATVTILNQVGMVIHTKEIYTGTDILSIDINNLKPGFYIVQVKKKG